MKNNLVNLRKGYNNLLKKASYEAMSYFTCFWNNLIKNTPLLDHLCVEKIIVVVRKFDVELLSKY